MNSINNQNVLLRKRNSLSRKVLFFFIWPFGTWIHCVTHAKEKSSYVIFFLFSMLLCWHMSPVGMNDKYDDFIGIMTRFMSTSFTTNEIIQQIQAFFSLNEDAPKELYENLLIWFVKLFTDNYHFFFLAASIPIAFFQLKSLQYITKDNRYKQGTLIAFLIIALFIFPRDIITAQNPRFATGFWYCVYLTICYYCKPRKNYIYLMGLFFAPFFHSAMWLFVGIVSISIIIPLVNLRILELLAIISIAFSLYNADLFQNIKIDFVPTYLQNWAEHYLDEESYARFIERKGASGYWWVGVLFDYLLKFAHILMTIQMIRMKDYVRKDRIKIYHFYLLLFIIVNVIQFVPELNTRYYNFTRVFCVLVWFLFFYGEIRREWTVKFLAVISLWFAMFRYGYFLGGALSVNTPPDIFFMPLPYLIGKGLFW